MKPTTEVLIDALETDDISYEDLESVGITKDEIEGYLEGKIALSVDLSNRLEQAIPSLFLGQLLMHELAFKEENA